MKKRMMFLGDGILLLKSNFANISLMPETTIQVSYEDMLKAGMHFGRKKTVFSPAMEKYVFTVRSGICIIDLLKTQEQLSNAIEFLKTTLKNNGLVLFVAPTKQSVDSIKDLAVSLGMPFVLERWLGGTLTNFKVINARVKRLEEMEKQQTTGELDKYTKKERLMFSKELAKMTTRFEGLKKLTRIPDAIFVASLKESALPVREAKNAHVKIVGIANTDSDPGDMDYAIPANDRSKKSVDLIMEMIKRELITNNE